MKLMETVKNVVKGGITMFAVGVALTFVGQAMAGAMGLDFGAIDLKTVGHANPLWIGAYFGGFGALHAAIAPALDWVFGGDKKEAGEKSAAKEINVSIVREPQQGVEPTVSMANYREMIEAQRSVATTTQKSV